MNSAEIREMAEQTGISRYLDDGCFSLPPSPSDRPSTPVYERVVTKAWLLQVASRMERLEAVVEAARMVTTCHPLKEIA